MGKIIRISSSENKPLVTDETTSLLLWQTDSMGDQARVASKYYDPANIGMWLQSYAGQSREERISEYLTAPKKMQSSQPSNLLNL